MDQVRKFLSKVYRGVGGARAKKFQRLLDAGEWALLQKERMDHPNNYQNANVYRRDSIVVEMTRKLLLPGDKDVRREAAVDTFWVSENQCANTNARLAKYLSLQGPFEDPRELLVIPFIKAWRKEVKRVLGKLSLNLDPGFSKGSTLSDSGKLTTIPDKMSSVPTVYDPSCSLNLMFKHTPMADSPPTVVRANRFFTVPKDSDKDRGCCIEASWNVSQQLAVGRLLKKKYRKAYGVDLANAQQLHRSLAQKASTGEMQLATIDLSNASDTVSMVLVKLLLPDDWYALLNSLRAKFTEIDEKTVLLNKFSSMGNGFTFELETILFRSLCVAVNCGRAWVYGDDIIVDLDRSADVIAALRFAGFTPNPKKTFCDGPFRESCGGDFFSGKPVRAHYMKELPDEPQKWIALANGLRNIDPDLRLLHAAWRFCVDQVPISWRNFGPTSLGDLCFHDPQAEPVLHTFVHKDPDPDRKRSGRNFVKTRNLAPAWRIMRPVSRSYDLGKYWSAKVAMAAGAYGVPAQVTTRNDVTGYKADYVIAWGISDDPAWWTQPDKL